MCGRGGKVGNGCEQHNCCDAIQQDEKTDGAAGISRTLPLEQEGIKNHFFSGTRWDVRHATKNFAEKAELPLFIQRLVRHPRGSWTPTRCPLMALSGLSDAPITRSAFGPIADMPNEYVECPLMTQSGHLLRTDAQLSGRACRSDLRCAHWFSHAVEDDNALATAAGR